MFPMKRLLCQPLLHFFLIGAALFALYAVVGDGGDADPDEIRIDAQRLAEPTLRFERTWQRPPTEAELKGLIDGWVRDEILYREGLALGLDQEDPVVRRRLAQKVDFMLDASVPIPDEAALQAWLDDNPERYRVSDKLALSQVFFSTEAGEEEARERAVAALAAADPGALGDSSLLPPGVPLSTAEQIARSFGEDFAAELASLPLQQWSGPLRSAYGLHLVRIEERVASPEPTLETVRAAVERDLMQSRLEEMKRSAFEALRERYTIVFDLDMNTPAPTDS
jgi:hypothetical protein